MVIIDIWNRAKPETGGKNLYSEAYDILVLLQSWAIENNYFVIVTHHLRKLSDEDNIFNTISGTTGTQASLDAMLVLRKQRGAYELHVTGRDIEEREFGMTFTDCLWTLEGSLEDTKLNNDQRAIINLLTSSDEPVKSADISEHLGKSADLILSCMVKANMIERVSKGYYTNIKKVVI